MSTEESPTSLSSHVFIEYAAEIVSASVSNNSVPAHEIPGFISAVQGAVGSLQSGAAMEAVEPTRGPAVPVKKSSARTSSSVWTTGRSFCLDDGKKFKSLRRHLTTLGMTPAEYRAKWDMPKDYPMIAPSYAAIRSELAKKSRLGSSRAAAAARGSEVRKESRAWSAAESGLKPVGIGRADGLRATLCLRSGVRRSEWTRPGWRVV